MCGRNSLPAESSCNRFKEFEDLRFHLMKTKLPAEAKAMLDRMATILSEEIKRTELSLETARRDSRLGYECEMDYVYTPRILSEKLRVLHETLEQELPAYRKQHEIP